MDNYLDLTPKRKTTISDIVEKSRIQKEAKEGLKREQTKERKENIRKGVEKYNKFTSQFHAPSVSGKMSYKTNNPLKKVLSHKGTSVKVSGSSEKTNLMRGSW